MLDDRKKKVLKAIIEEYVNTAEPVSSAAIVDKDDLKYSSATIRNDMAELEQYGYLDKPHTSAGRVPSDKGYRFYVNELLKEDNLSVEEIQYIKSRLEIKVNEIDELLKIATSTLSEVTHYTSIAVSSKLDLHTISDIKFVLLGDRLLMAVILTETGIIKETLIKFEEDINSEIIENLNHMFRNKLVGNPLSIIRTSMEEFLKNELAESKQIAEQIIRELSNIVIQNDDSIYLEGASKAFNYPEFEKVETAKNFLSVIEAKDLVRELMDNGIVSDINVYIGDENADEALKDFSVITFKHTLDNKEVGTIGIIGPTRMNYSKVISVMKYISKEINEKMNKGGDSSG